MDWSQAARDTIAKASAEVPETATWKERRAAINAAYPFGLRKYWPYKAWLKALREHMGLFDENGKRVIAARPTGLEHLPRDPVTGRPII